MLLGGHGQKDQIHFGDKVGGSVNVEDIRGQGIKRLTEFFVPEATVILESCSTGSDQGIAEAISKFFGTKVIAPKVPTFMEEIQIKKTEKGLDFKVEYFDDDKSVFEKGVRTNG
jgi:hypothetical protein